jgi:hypothetical protein
VGMLLFKHTKMKIVLYYDCRAMCTKIWLWEIKIYDGHSEMVPTMLFHIWWTFWDGPYNVVSCS